MFKVWHETASDGEALGSIPSLPLLPGSLVSVPSMGQIDLFENYKYWIRIYETTYKKENCTRTIRIVRIVIKHLEMNQILALNNP